MFKHGDVYYTSADLGGEVTLYGFERKGMLESGPQIATKADTNYF